VTAVLLGGLWSGMAAWWTWARTLPVRLPPDLLAPACPTERPAFLTPSRRRLAAVGLGVVVAMLVHPALVVVPIVAGLVLPRLDARRRVRRHDGAVIDQLPDIVDLVRLTTDAGLPVSGAITALGDRPGGPLGAALASTTRLLDRGASTGEALAGLLDAGGPAARPLVDALADHDRYGTPLGPVLDRVAFDSRLRRRRAAEEAARRLPVTLLFPLVLTTLPAFALLTVVPLLVGSFSSLRL
jgi:tight adherence protein C